MKRLCLTAAIAAISFSVTSAQNRPGKTVPRGTAQPPAVAAPTVGANAVNRPPASGPKPYNQVITEKAKTDNGFFKVHNVDDRYYFEIPDSLLGRDILVVNRISKAAAGVRAGMSGYAGDEIGDNVIRFEKGPSNRIFLKNISFGERASDTTGMYRSVLNSSLQPILASFDIKAYHTDSITKSSASVIDMQDYLNGDNDVFFFDAQTKRSFSLGAAVPDRSYISNIRAFPANIEVRTVKTYMKMPAPVPGAVSGGPVTFELNSSIVLLPRNPMKPRFYDPRVGYFATGYVDFDANPQGVKRISMITRWKLEPKPQDVERYLKGELVEPAKQIVFYIDPATPKKWIPYLIQGVNDWQAAFEKAGFKNAIIAKEAPKDPNWSIDDATHNAIVYKPSDIPNASGPHVHDPRSGEIIETHVNWYHNVMSLVRNWYMIQAAAIDPKARKMTFDDKLMGELIRFVSSHEIGHTLGLRHNFGSSSTVPVENLRNKQWVEANGHTPSIMDYARFNYVAQPEDNISEKGIFPRINDYDKWAIEWGYKWMPEYKTAEAESPFLNRWIIDRTSANKRLWFGTETDPNDPRSQSEDLGDNAMLAGTYGIKNLKRIIPNILTWTRTPGSDYDDARMIYNEVTTQFGRYIGHVLKNVGGIYSTPKTVEEQGPQFVITPYSRQKDAVSFLSRELFKTPKWLISSELIGKAGIDPLNTIKSLQAIALGRLLNASTFLKLLSAEATNGAKTYRATELIADLNASIWTELPSHAPIDIYRRNLQKSFVESMSQLMKGALPLQFPVPGQLTVRQMDPIGSDIPSIARGYLTQLRADIKKATPSTTGITRYHLQDMSYRIGKILEGEQNK
ncbi:zinc-dependent metalloprotease [Pedobacter sp. R-06]|uniref:zinc-dependent metalloprotease n=1 Tax=Pedobacter sp. R-06 TaxID=3404051 RepID=UPI003CE8E36B